jgi:hypothetical protein
VRSAGDPLSIVGTISSQDFEFSYLIKYIYKKGSHSLGFSCLISIVLGVKTIMGPIYADRSRKNKKITTRCKKKFHENVFEIWRKEKTILSSK